MRPMSAEPETGLVDQPLASSEMGESMDADLLPQLSGETWVALALLEELTADLLPAGADLDLIVASRQDTTLATVREWIQSGSIPVWAECAGLSPLPDKTAISVVDAFFSNIVCRFGMPSVIHSDQGREFENKVMHELCILGGSHKTKTTPYHPERIGGTLQLDIVNDAGDVRRRKHG